MKKILIYYDFIIVSLVVLAGFLNAQSYIDLVFVIPFIPLVAYFGIFIFPRRNRAIILPQKISLKKAPLAAPLEQNVVKPPARFAARRAVEGEILEERKEGLDLNRRVFLKLIGSAGLSVFFFALFTKKAEAAFFGSVPGPGTLKIKDKAGNQIDPAEKQPTDGYNISRVDDSTPAYYGFIDKESNWFIMKEGSDGTYLYAKGSSDFAGNWALRNNEETGPTFDYFDETF